MGGLHVRASDADRAVFAKLDLVLAWLSGLLEQDAVGERAQHRQWRDAEGHDARLAVAQRVQSGAFKREDRLELR